MSTQLKGWQKAERKSLVILRRNLNITNFNMNNMERRFLYTPQYKRDIYK